MQKDINKQINNASKTRRINNNEKKRCKKKRKAENEILKTTEARKIE
jgi:hypothetical protein